MVHRGGDGRGAGGGRGGGRGRGAGDQGGEREDGRRGDLHRAGPHRRSRAGGSRSRCASNRSSHIATAWSVVRVAAVFGSSSAAWYTWSRDSSRAARTVSSTTLRNVLFNDASCGGRAPTGTGLAPPAPTRQGTSTQHSSGRLVKIGRASGRERVW